MNEVEELSKLDPAGLPPLKPILLDDLYQSVGRTSISRSAAGPSSTSSRRAIRSSIRRPDEAITGSSRAASGSSTTSRTHRSRTCRVLRPRDISSYFIGRTAASSWPASASATPRAALRDQVLNPRAQGAPVPI